MPQSLTDERLIRETLTGFRIMVSVLGKGKMSLRNKNIKVISYEIARQWQIDGKKFATPSLDEVIRGKSNRGIVYEVFNQNGVSRYYIVK